MMRYMRSAPWLDYCLGGLILFGLDLFISSHVRSIRIRTSPTVSETLVAGVGRVPKMVMIHTYFNHRIEVNQRSSTEY
jgi:hypothetical protein